MNPITPAELRDLYGNDFQSYRQEDWCEEWRRNYADHVRMVRDANLSAWLDPGFQKRLWDNTAVAAIGPGQSVTLVRAYSDEALARKLFEARGMLEGIPVDQRGARLQVLYDEVLAKVHPEYTPRRPKARLVRLLAALFPNNMTCLMDAGRVWSLQRYLGAARVPGDFIAQHPTLQGKIREALGEPVTIEEIVDQSIFAWFLWQTKVDQHDEGAVVVQSTQTGVVALPSISLLPANAQRRSLPYVSNNLSLLVAMVREAEQGISRDDLVGVILAEATQLNASSAGNLISQAMGGLGLIKLESNAYRPTERGQDLLKAGDPAEVLRAPLVGRVFGMGHLLLMVRREPGKLRVSDASRRLRELVPTWTSTQPGSYIVTWAKLAGLVHFDSTSGGGRLTLTDDGEDYAAALPDDFDERWQVLELEEAIESSERNEDPDLNPATVVSAEPYGVDEIRADGCFLEAEELKSALAILRRKKNLILQGPPGTGKTWLAKRLGYALIGYPDSERLLSVQFQPSLSYEDFVRGWRPDGTGGLQLADGAFLDAIAAALSEPKRPYVLVIEEINRGNPAQILGELLTLIEDSKRREDEALRLAYPRTLNERVYVPDNLFIIGTMNLADRSLALVDLALRRRFAFVTLTPALGESWMQWCTRMGAPMDLVEDIADKMRALNSAIAADRTLGPQFAIGHSFVTPNASPGASLSDWVDWYAETVRTEIAPLLFEYWYDNRNEAETQVRKLAV